MRRNLTCGMLVVVALAVSGISQQSVPLSPTQVPSAIAQGPQRHNPPAQPQAQSGVPTAAPPPLTNMHAPYTGTIEGYVYWDANAINHKPAASCNGLAITVSLGTPLGGSGMEQFKPLSTLSNNFKFVGSVGTYAVCTYGFDQVPVGQDMQVQVSVTTPLAFSPISAPAVAITGPIKIINGKCNNLPPAVPSPSDLTSHWWTCGNYAYNVNFVLQPSAHVMSATGGSGGLLSTSSSTQPTLLSNTPNRGMLAGTAGATPALSPAGTQNGSVNPGPSQTTSFQTGSSVAVMAPAPAGTTPLPPSSGSSPAASGKMAQPLPLGVQTSMQCAQDPTFRIVSVSGLSRNTFLPSGTYTIWGCAFGNMSSIKAPVPLRSQSQTVASASPTAPPNSVFVAGSGSGLSGMIPVMAGASINSWSDNSITVTFPSPTQLGSGATSSPYQVQLYVVRGDGKTASQGGYLFQFPPPSSASSCALQISSISPTPIQPGGQFKIYGCGFGTSGSLDLNGGSAQMGTDFVAFLHPQLWTDSEIDFTFSTSDVKASPSLTQAAGTLTVSRSSDGASVQTSVQFHY